MAELFSKALVPIYLSDVASWSLFLRFFFYFYFFVLSLEMDVLRGDFELSSRD